MRNDFAVFILTHRRPDKQTTLKTLRRGCYSGNVFLVVDDEDPMLDEYRAKYGDAVRVFSKEKYDKRFDIADNFKRRDAVVWARNASYDIAAEVGARYFLMHDDDYGSVFSRFGVDGTPRNVDLAKTADGRLDKAISSMLKWYIKAKQISTLCMAQGGDWIGGHPGVRSLHCRRKSMNTFFCDTERRIEFTGRLNEDTTAYCYWGHIGLLFLTAMQIHVVQEQTQKSAGGLTDAYLDLGTYAKSFYSVMHCPSFVQIGAIKGHGGNNAGRIHHEIDYERGLPKIMRASVKRRA